MSWNSDNGSEPSYDAEEPPIETQLEESLCDHWYSFMTKPEYTFGATLFFSLINLCVIVTISLIFVESFPSFRRDTENVFFQRMEVIFTIIFTFEYVTKLFIAPFCKWNTLLDFEEDRKKQYELWGTVVMSEDSEDEEQKAEHACRTWFAKLYYFITDFPNLVDLMAILPVYIQLLIGGGESTFQAIKILRLSRGLRIFKSIRDNKKRKISTVLMDALPAMAELLGFATLFMFVGACAIFAFESGEWNEEYGDFMRPKHSLRDELEPTPFNSLFDATYYVCVAILGSIQFGPATVGGRITAVILTLVIYVVFAMFLAVIGATYMDYLYENDPDSFGFQHGVEEGLKSLEKKVNSLHRKLDRVISLVSHDSKKATWSDHVEFVAEPSAENSQLY